MAETKKPIWLRIAIASLRKASYQLPAMNEAMKKARQGRGVYVCAKCFGLFGRKEVQRDHIEPAVHLNGWQSLDAFAERLLNVEEKDIQILCRPCHKEKTLAENAIRRANTKEKDEPRQHQEKNKRVASRPKAARRKPGDYGTRKKTPRRK